MHRGVEDRLARPPEAVERGLIDDCPPDRVCVAGGEDRLGEDEPDPATIGARQSDGERQELGGRIRVGAAAVPRSATSAGGGIELVEVGRVADDGVEPHRAGWELEGVAHHDGGVRSEAALRHVGRCGIELDAGEAPRRFVLADPEPPPDALGGSSQEPPVAARRVEHDERVVPRALGQEGFEDRVEHMVDQPPGCGPGAAAASLVHA